MTNERAKSIVARIGREMTAARRDLAEINAAMEVVPSAWRSSFDGASYSMDRLLQAIDEMASSLRHAGFAPEKAPIPNKRKGTRV